MLRKATQDDLPALVALRCKAARTNRTDAAGWLQNVAGLEIILLLVKSGAPPAAMLAAVPVEYGQHHGVWFCGLAGAGAGGGGGAGGAGVCCPNCWKAACGLMGPAALTLPS